MTHPLSGFASADESARLIRNYRYAVERMMRILGGWIALTPELPAKLLMGRHVWDNAQHADALGRRLPELRAQAQVSEPVNAGFVAFMDAIESTEQPAQTVERLVGVYRVLKPHLLASYDEHLHRANEVYEPPTRRLLARCAEDERRHISAGVVILRHLASTSALEARAQAWQARLEDLLAAAGGVTGRGLPPAAPAATPSSAPGLSDDAHEFIRLGAKVDHWPIPEDLEAAIRRLGDALIARDAEGLRDRGVSAAALSEDAASALAGRDFARHRIVACASIGQHRLVKLKLESSTGAGVTLVARWARAAEGWRAVTLDLVSVDLAHSA